MAAPVVTDFTWGFFDDDSADPDTCTQIGADDSTSETHALDTNLMVRIGSQNSSAAVVNAVAQLQYRVGTGGTWTDVTASSSNVRASLGSPTDDALCDVQLLTSGSGAFESDGAFDEGDGAVPAHSHAKTTFFEDQWCVQLRSAELSGSEVIFFRTVFAGATMNYGTDPTGLPQITAEAAAPTYTGAGVLVLAAVLLAGVGTYTPPVYEGFDGFVFAPIALAGTGEFVPPDYAGDGVFTLAPIGLSGVGNYGETYTGAGALSLAPIVLAATGTYTAPIYDGLGLVGLAPVALAGTGSYTVPVYDGAGGLAIASVGLVGTGSSAPPVYDGAGGIGFAPITLAGIGNYGEAYDGGGGITLAPIGLAGSGESGEEDDDPVFHDRDGRSVLTFVRVRPLRRNRKVNL